MSFHSFLDRAVLSASALTGDSMKFFNRNVESPGLKEILGSAEIASPLSLDSGEHDTAVRCGGRAVSMRYRIMSEGRRGSDILIFHHGSGDIPYYKRIKKIIRADSSGVLGDLMIIATDSPSNRSGREYLHAAGGLDSFSKLLAFSAVLMEAVVSVCRTERPGRIIVSGISLGGWIANIHHTYFNSADIYRPVFAGAAPDALFLESEYRKMTAASALENPRKITEALNFESDFRKRGGENVFPLMAVHDQYIRYDRQSGIYSRDNISLIEAGHVSGSAKYSLIAAFLGGGGVPAAASGKNSKFQKLSK